MTEELEQLFYSKFNLRQRLSQVLPQEAVEYIVNLIVLDQAHQKYIKLEKELEEV